MENSIEKVRGELIVSLSKRDQAQLIADVLTRAVLIAGIKPSEDEIELMILEVTDLIRTRYQNLTIREIEETIRCGAMGDYQDSYLSVRNINIWLKTFNAEKQRKTAFNEKKESLEKTMSMAERGNFFMKNIDKMPSLKKLLDKNESKR